MTFPLVELLLLMICALALISFSGGKVSAGSLSDEEIERKILNKPPLKTFQLVFLLMEPKYKMFGAGADIQMQNLTLAQDQFSTASIWILSEPSFEINVIAAGWKVSPSLYGDSRTPLFTYWRLPHMVDSSLMRKSKSFRTVKVEIRGGCSWNRTDYWGTGLRSPSPMGDGAVRVAWGGVVKAGKDGTSPPMGNGHFSDGNYSHSSLLMCIMLTTRTKWFSNRW
ncbi:hypothetical protein L484_023258 [Morus notabilis]|uniref:Neprosin PEP catalytic domain-containing protein n=1 Tax=Morus notabilis TaxID=981085 RepID=W9RYX8_9ROSA|nr:hypothetical protein L484_023258 [Morus notabilis]